MSTQQLPDNLASIRSQLEGQVEELVRSRINKALAECSAPSGLESYVEVAIGLDRRPIIAKVLEDSLRLIKEGLNVSK